jgi:hypothetical protein
MPLIIFLFILFLNPYPTLENPCGSMFPRGYDEDWGIGAYFLDDDFEAFVYSDTTGTIVGRIEVVDSHVRFYDIFKRRVLIADGDIEWIGHYSYEFLKVRKSSSSRYVQCLWKTTPDLYLDTVEIKSQYRLLTYRELLFEKEIMKEIKGFVESGVNVGVNLTRTCLNVRTGPSVDSTKIACIPRDLNLNEADVRIKILDQSNDWAYVLVEAYVFQEGDYDCPSKLEKSMKGWVKAIADNGFPNLWYAVTSY